MSTLQPQPQSIADSLAKGLASYGDSQSHCDFTLARFERDARKLENIDPILGLAMQGVVASFRLDEDAMDGFFAEAISLGGDQFTIYYNYGVACQNMGLFSKAAACYESSLESAENDLTRLRFLLARSTSCALTGLAKKIINSLNSLNEIRSEEVFMINVNEAYANLNIPEDVILEMLSLAGGVLRRNKVFCTNQAYSALPDHEMIYSFEISGANEDDLAAYNFEIAEAFAESQALLKCDVSSLSIMCKGVS